MMLASRNDSPNAARQDDIQLSRTGFTLVELLVTISIIAVLASLVLVGLAGVQETARRDRTRAQIAKIDSMIGEKWESFRTRRLPLVLPPNLPLNEREMLRVEAMRALMVMELPDSRREVRDALTSTPNSSLWLAYRRAARRFLINKHRLNESSTPLASTPQFNNIINQYWSDNQESAECLYLILSQIFEDDQAALEFFPERERGDVDNDGMPEIIDAWGTPIRFIRWAPGITPYENFNFSAFSNRYPAVPGIPGTPQDSETPDPLNPRQVMRVSGGVGVAPPNRVLYALYPLILSAGSDKVADIEFGGVQSLPPQLALDPYFSYNMPQIAAPIGFHFDKNENGKAEYLDNISNHSLYAQ